MEKIGKLGFLLIGASGKVLPDDEDEGNDEEEPGEYDGNEFLIEDVRHTKTAAARAASKIDKGEGNRYPPVRKLQPRPKDFFPKKVGY